jgi:hypothetical protein
VLHLQASEVLEARFFPLDELPAKLLPEQREFIIAVMGEMNHAIHLVGAS